MIKRLLKKFGWTIIKADRLEALLDDDIPLMDIGVEERSMRLDIYLMARELYINSINTHGYSNYEKTVDHSIEASISFHSNFDSWNSKTK
jgi:hypothetical protein